MMSEEMSVQHLSELVTALTSKVQELEDRVTGADLDAEIRRLSVPIVNGNPAYDNYLAARFLEYDIALLNVKQMGYYIGQKEMERTGALDRIKRPSQPYNGLLPSKICTQNDCESDWYFYWLQELQSGYVYHRKLWEFCYIAQQLFAAGVLKSGKRGLGFGCGEEPLPSLFAKFGAASCGTDLDPHTSSEQKQGWIEAGAHSSSREKLLHRNICSDEEHLKLISHDFADMNDIPEKFNGKFDFTWSSCALEHCGSIEKGLKFIENSVKTLRLGGVAVHTTEYNLRDGETVDNWGTVFFQRKHMEDLERRLKSAGYIVSPFDFDGGGGVLDGLFDIAPWPWETDRCGWQMLYAVSHLKKAQDGVACTSIGITVQRPG